MSKITEFTTIRKQSGLLHSYIGYGDANNPEWFKRMVNNMFRISYYNWHIRNSWAGMFWKRKKLKRVIKKLRADNWKILDREFPTHKEEYRFVFDIWKNHRGQSVSVLEIWRKK